MPSGRGKLCEMCIVNVGNFRSQEEGGSPTGPLNAIVIQQEGVLVGRADAAWTVICIG